jgi:hypothetical protein
VKVGGGGEGGDIVQGQDEGESSYFDV